ncbi:MAG: flagellar motor switch protein FliM, partial [Puniceicoccaceae bacterium]
DRYLTEIEMNLLEEVVQVILEEWCRQWKEEQELDASLIGRESNGRFLQTSPQDAIMLVLSMEATIGDCSETIQVAVPYYTLEPIIKTIHARRQREAFQSKVEKRPDWSDAYDSIRVPVTAEWDAMEVTVQELMQLRSGDVIRLPREVIRRTRVRLMNTTKFEGEVGLEGDRVVVRIGSRTTSEEES